VSTTSPSLALYGSWVPDCWASWASGGELEANIFENSEFRGPRKGPLDSQESRMKPKLVMKIGNV